MLARLVVLWIAAHVVGFAMYVWLSAEQPDVEGM